MIDRTGRRHWLRCLGYLTAVVSMLVSVSKGNGAEEDFVVADFDGPSYGDWKVEGTAFGSGPARGTLPNQMPVSGFLGAGLVNSFVGGDGSVGMLTSPLFEVRRRYLNFLIAGGFHDGKTSVELLQDGEVVRQATGHQSEHLVPGTWDVGAFLGKQVQIRVVDQATGSWGHINVDQIVQSDMPAAPVSDNPALARAMASVQSARAKAEADPRRPHYHFASPALWMNDPNGLIQYRGVYHVFYQHNPYGDEWGHMHWGHARSKDLVHWEHLPIALWPSLEKGEEHCFSGCMARGPEGKPMAFYTSIGPKRPAGDGAEQWVAIPKDGDLVEWEKHSANPVLAESLHGKQKIYDWRDPYVFQAAGRTYLVLGGNLNGAKGGKAIVALYEAEAPSLNQWKHRGILFQHPDADVVNIECPNFFPLRELDPSGKPGKEKWVLIISPHRRVEYFVGDFDPIAGKFEVSHRGLVDHGDAYYAPNGLVDDKGRHLLWGWVRGFPPGRGWNGCLTLPRKLSLTSEGILVQTPAEEITTLRKKVVEKAGISIDAKPYILPGIDGDSFEAEVAIEPNKAKIILMRLSRNQDTKAPVLKWSDGTLDVAGAKVPAARRS
ncbi:MAG: glycoside hydrolase family 32 protein [Planctomycetota bacterium]